MNKKYVKLVKIDELNDKLKHCRGEFKIGFTCGTFDVMHTGHIEMFEECSKKCDILVVGLQADPSIDRPEKNAPIQEIYERVPMLNATSFIDYVIIYNTEKDLYSILQQLNPDIRFIGSDWVGKQYTGNDLPIEVIFNKRDHSYSSSNLRKRIYNAERKKRGFKDE